MIRLLNISTGRLESFWGEKPPYAILSHRWTDNEPTFEEFVNNPTPILESVKISGFCAQAAHYSRLLSLKYVWVDTICIDKRQSAELDEAINSMYQWYEEAEICYVYLSDVALAEQPPQEKDSMFRKSVWFTRGWTLQELLAPQQVVFYDQSWREIGWKTIKDDRSRQGHGNLTSLVSEITGIHEPALDGTGRFRQYSFAQKMSWAANRETTRIEDRAYSLIGIFDVNMPVIYGEGDKAFLRLQEEVQRQTDDMTTLAYNYGSKPFVQSSISKRINYPPTADHFADCHGVVPLDLAQKFRLISQYDSRKHVRNDEEIEHCIMTNKGLNVQLDVLELPDLPGTLVARLDCICQRKIESSLETRIVVLPLYNFQATNSKVVFRSTGTPLVDVSPASLFSDRMSAQLLYIANNMTVSAVPFLEIKRQEAYCVAEIYPPMPCIASKTSTSFKCPTQKPPPVLHLRIRREDDRVDFIMKIELEYDGLSASPVAGKFRMADMPARMSLLEALVLGKGLFRDGRQDASRPSDVYRLPVSLQVADVMVTAALGVKGSDCPVNLSIGV